MTHKNKIETIARLFKNAIEKKYEIIEIKLFGSSARGDYSEDSDIDIMVMLPVVNRKVEEDLFNIAYDLELEYDCIIDVIILPQNLNYIPLCQNILMEGKTI